MFFFFFFSEYFRSCWWTSRYRLSFSRCSELHVDFIYSNKKLLCKDKDEPDSTLVDSLKLKFENDLAGKVTFSIKHSHRHSGIGLFYFLELTVVLKLITFPWCKNL